MSRWRSWFLVTLITSIAGIAILVFCVRFTSLHTTLLFDTASSGSDFGTRLLIACSGDMNARDKDQFTPLMWAVRQPRIEVIQTLLRSGADPNARADNKGTALMWAAGFGNAQAVRVLLEAGADPNLTDDRGDIALCAALASGKSGSIECDDILIKAGGFHGMRVPFGRIEHSVTALGHARALLDNGVDPNEVGEDGTTALMIFAYDGNYEVSALLVEHGAKVNAVSKNGHTALTEAVSQGCPDEVDFLIRHGADGSQKRDGQDLIDIARHKLDAMIKAGAQFAVPNDQRVVQLLEEDQARRAKVEKSNRR